MARSEVPLHEELNQTQYYELMPSMIRGEEIVGPCVLSLVYETSLNDGGYERTNVLVNRVRPGRRSIQVAYYAGDPKETGPVFAYLGSDGFMLWTRKEKGGFFTHPLIKDPDLIDPVERELQALILDSK